MTTLAAGSTTERRLGPDRRRRPTSMLSRYWLRGQRRGGRRDGETARIYVDRYTTAELTLAASVLALAVADVVLTGMHLAGGGAEVNPWLGELLRVFGFSTMTAVKLIVTGLSLIVLLLHVRWPIARAGLIGLCTAHVLLLGWHTLVAVDRITT